VQQPRPRDVWGVGDDRYALAYEEAKEAVAAQAAVADALRARAGVVMSAAAVSTSLFGARLDAAPGIAAWTAIAAFALLGVAAVAVVWPLTDRFIVDPRGVLRAYVEREGAADLTAMRRELTLGRGTALRRNAAALRRAERAFRAATALLAAETAAWSVDLATRA
jgi:hypothetical protein